MKSSSLHTAFVVAVISIAPTSFISQAVAQNTRGTSVAVLDVAKVFKETVSFKQKMDSMKEEAKEFERSINKQQQDLVKRAKSIDEFTPSSLEHKRAVADITQGRSDLNVKLQLKRKEMMEREAKIYYETYNQMLDIVNALADQHGLSLVLRFDSTTMESADRASVLGKVNQFVIIQRRLDLTKMVINQLNGS